MYKRYQIYITGNVQRVGFRNKAFKMAQRLNISGSTMYIDHAIKIEAEGEMDRLLDFVAWCRVGPESCTIDSFEITEIPPLFTKGFELIHGIVSSRKLTDLFA